MQCKIIVIIKKHENYSNYSTYLWYFTRNLRASSISILFMRITRLWSPKKFYETQQTWDHTFTFAK